MKDYGLSIILLSYNTRQLLSECLTRLNISVQKAETEFSVPIEVIVLDNASTDGSPNMIRDVHPWVKLIKSEVNTGFGKGNNSAVNKSKYGNILFLNSDVLVQDSTITDAVRYFNANPDIGVLGIQLENEDGSFQSAGGYLPTVRNMFLWQSGAEAIPFIRKSIKPFHLRDKISNSGIIYLGWVMGAFFMIRKNVFLKAGGFDEQIFLYAEEVELCIRLNKAGLKIGLTGDLSAVHLGSASSEKKSAEPLFLETKTVLYIFKKHFPGKLAIIKVFIFFGSLLRYMYYFMLNDIDKRSVYAGILKLLRTSNHR